MVSKWSAERESNPQRPAWKADALPLCYLREKWRERDLNPRLQAIGPDELTVCSTPLSEGLPYSSAVSSPRCRATAPEAVTRNNPRELILGGSTL